MSKKIFKISCSNIFVLEGMTLDHKQKLRLQLVVVLCYLYSGISWGSAARFMAWLSMDHFYIKRSIWYHDKRELCSGFVEKTELKVKNTPITKGLISAFFYPRLQEILLKFVEIIFRLVSNQWQKVLSANKMAWSSNSLKSLEKFVSSFFPGMKKKSISGK
jgi:hypothetical protein